MAVVAYYLLRYTYIGRQIYAVGGNVEAARFSGVNVDTRIILCYIVSVVCASMVGMIQAARLSLGHPGSGEGYELLAITACILGGVSFMGGQGGVIGIVVGALLIGDPAEPAGHGERQPVLAQDRHQPRAARGHHHRLRSPPPPRVTLRVPASRGYLRSPMLS